MSETGPTPLPARAARTPARQKARQLARALRGERPDYPYLKEVFRHLRAELGVAVARPPERLPVVPTEDGIRRFYEAVWRGRRMGDVVLIKTLLYTGVRVSELVALRLEAVDLDRCQLRVTAGKGGKDRVVPFPAAFKETLALHAAGMTRRGATCSSRAGSAPTATGASASSWRATPKRPATPSRSRPTGCATSC